MKIKLLKRKTKQFKEFTKKEWKEVDLENYGKSPVWEVKHLVFEARENEQINR